LFEATENSTEHYAMMASGNYRIVYCGQHSRQIAQLLQSIWLTIQEALESIDSAGPAGTPLYNTFFRGVDPTTVKAVLERIAIGASIPTSDGAHNPTIVCDNPSVPSVLSSDVHAECATMRGLMALWVKESNTVFLCPKYLLTTRLEPASQHCVGYLPSGRYSMGIMLGETQWSVLFHELVHLYLRVSSLEEEARGIFAAVDLPPSQAAVNPSSYVFFLASMLAPHLCLWFFGRVRTDVTRHRYQGRLHSVQTQGFASPAGAQASR
jgi:hypothetical protein